MISNALSNPIRRFIYSCLKFAQQDCVLCGAGSGTDLLCAGCRPELPRAPAPACPLCAGPIGAGPVYAEPGDQHVCGTCLTHPPAYDRTFAALSYGFPTDELIQALKYRSQLPLAPLFAELLGQIVGKAPRPDRVIPLPLHPDRARERGFNQATEIAKPLAKTLGIAFDTTSLTRARNTAAQAALPLERRHRNVKGAFTCAETVAGMHVAVVDDVMTSGATLNEAAKALKQAGAAEVSLWVVARAVPHH
jgi:ComF family protein